MGRLHDKATVIDLVTVANELGDRDLEDVGLSYLSQLLDGMPPSINVGTHAQIGRDPAARRAVIQMANRLSLTAYDGASDPAALLGAASEAIASARSQATDSGNLPVFASLADVLTRIAEGRSARRCVIGDLIALG